jgi:hypothetical protein
MVACGQKWASPSSTSAGVTIGSTAIGSLSGGSSASAGSARAPVRFLNVGL